jgi:hypothetical protein
MASQLTVKKITGIRRREAKLYSSLTLSDPKSDFVQYYDFPVPDAFPHVVRTLAGCTLSVSVYIFLF